MVVYRIQTDHNEDNSAEILKEWVDNVSSNYHFVELETDNSAKRFKDEEGIAHWTDLRYRHVIELREKAFKLARDSWADYIWVFILVCDIPLFCIRRMNHTDFFTQFLDCDSFITSPHTLTNLIEKQKVIVAPMLLSDSMYSNFWCGMTPSYYYKRTEDYEKILNREESGCFQVPMVHSAVLINLRSSFSDSLTYSPSKIQDYNGPADDIIAFAIGANKSGNENF